MKSRFSGQPDPAALNDLGAWFGEHSNYSCAAEAFATSLQMDPKQPRALYEMGKLQAQQGDKGGALQSFAALQAADPKFARSHKVDDEIARLK